MLKIAGYQGVACLPIPAQLSRTALDPFTPELPSFTNEVCPAGAPEIEANSVSEDFNGTLLCIVAMVARNYLDASGANVNPSRERYARNSKESGGTYGEDVFAHELPPLAVFTQQVPSYLIVPLSREVGTRAA